ncbi:hypothetical protein R2A130_1074 [Ahrensia sp. R2A130]|nr:hypothetical protein R2A130_1074 [Ahrensia sp. R2A130]
MTAILFAGFILPTQSFAEGDPPTPVAYTPPPAHIATVQKKIVCKAGDKKCLKRARSSGPKKNNRATSVLVKK